MAVSREVVDKVARLSRLAVSEADAATYAGQLGAILEYVETLAKLPLDGVEPLAHPTEIANIPRADAPAAGLSAEEALRSAADRQDGHFRVPPVIDDPAEIPNPKSQIPNKSQ